MEGRHSCPGAQRVTRVASRLFVISGPSATQTHRVLGASEIKAGPGLQHRFWLLRAVRRTIDATLLEGIGLGLLAGPRIARLFTCLS